MGLLSQELNEFIRGNQTIKVALDKITAAGDLLPRCVDALEGIEKALWRISHMLRQTTEDDEMNCPPNRILDTTIGDTLAAIKQSLDDM